MTEGKPGFRAIDKSLTGIRVISFPTGIVGPALGSLLAAAWSGRHIELGLVPLGALGTALGVEGGLSLERLFGWVFAPVAWVVGVEGWGDCQAWGTLLGTKISINEFVAYGNLAQMQPGDAGLVQAAGPPLVFAAERSARMAAYALCGFANFSSIGIQIGGISALAPGRKADLSRLAFKAMLGGAFATCMTAAIAGMFL